MKKLLLSSLIVTSIAVFAYTQTDVDNATYLAGKGIITSQSTTAGYRLDDSITRAEVAGIALKLKWINLPENYQCRKYFSDVTKNDWICRAVEIAADARFISRTNTTFRPQDKITRAEALAIIEKAGGLEKITYIPGVTDMRGSIAFEKAVEIAWQRDVFWTYINKSYQYTQEWGENFEDDISYNPNNSASRAEVFRFTKNIMEIRTTMSGEITITSQDRAAIEK